MAPPTVLKGLEHHALFLLLIQLSLLLTTAWVLGEIMRKLRQPPVVGELLAGVLLGPSSFGLAFPELQSEIFPPVQSQADLLSVVAWLGVLFLLIVTGLETDVRLIAQKGRSAILISAGGIIVPFASGLLLGWLMPDQYLAKPDLRLVFALFMAVAMSISAVPVIAKVLFDLKLVRRDIGQLTLAAAMTDDTIGWILLSIVASLAAHGVVEVGSVLLAVGAAVAFLAVAFTIGGPIVGRLVGLVDRSGGGAVGQFSLVLVLAFGAAAFTQEMGLEAVLGAFVVGILVGQARRFRSEVAHTLEVVTAGFVAPIFFASAGLKVDLLRLIEPDTLIVGAVVLAIACLGKFVGCYFGAWAGGLSHWERLAMGSGMNARGAMEIIVATVGLGLGVLSPEIYSVIVMVAIVTSLMAPPLLRWTLSHVEMSEAEVQRLEREAAIANSFVRSIRRVLMVARDAGQAELVADLVGHLKKAQPMEVSAMYASLDQEPVPWWKLFRDEPRRAFRTFRDGLRRVRKAVRRVDGSSVAVKVAAGASAANAVLEEAAQGYDLIAMAVSAEARVDGLLFGPVVDRVVMDAPCATLILQGPPKRNGERRLKKILVPTTGTEHGKHAAEAAALLALSAGASVTILNVVIRSDAPLAGDIIDTERAREIAEDLVDGQAQLAWKLGVDATPRVIEGASSDAALLSLLQSEQFDLVMIGTSARTVRQRAYLGRSVEALLNGAPCAVAIVCTN